MAGGRVDVASRRTAIVRLHPLVPELWHGVAQGMDLGLREGHRKLGDAHVLEVIPPADTATKPSA